MAEESSAPIDAAPGASVPEGATTNSQCTFFRKPPRNRNLRKRNADEEEGESGEGGGGSAVVHRSKVGRKGGFSTATGKEKPDDAAEDGLGKNTIIYESSREVQTQDSLATASLETETEFDKDARALREKVLKAAAKRKEKGKEMEGEGSKTDGKKQELYKGLNAYTDHRAGFRRENSIAAEKAGGAHGPLRASQHIRMSARFDYQPDVCKDYKETGYCGFGDSCKFMHDRGDYKSGWQLEREWEEAQKVKRERLERQMRGLLEEEEGKEEEEDDDLPFACFICRESFVDPVVTICKHYFCEHCALKHYMTSKACFVCNKPTNGLFNTAYAILKKKLKK